MRGSSGSLKSTLQPGSRPLGDDIACQGPGSPAGRRRDRAPPYRSASEFTGHYSSDGEWMGVVGCCKRGPGKQLSPSFLRRAFPSDARASPRCPTGRCIFIGLGGSREPVRPRAPATASLENLCLGSGADLWRSRPATDRSLGGSPEPRRSGSGARRSCPSARPGGDRGRPARWPPPVRRSLRTRGGCRPA